MPRPKTSEKRQAVSASDLPPVMYFKSTVAAFAYACEFFSPEIKVGHARVALVTGEHIRRRDSGFQSADIWVSGDNDYFYTNAITKEPNVPQLVAKDLVYWLPTNKSKEIEQLADGNAKIDKRIAWYGEIVAVLAPELLAATAEFRIKIDYQDYMRGIAKLDAARLRSRKRNYGSR
jgi:hypothetical protein